MQRFLKFLSQLKRFYFPSFIRTHSFVHGLIGFCAASIGTKLALTHGDASPLLLLVSCILVYVCLATAFACSMRFLENLTTNR